MEIFILGEVSLGNNHMRPLVILKTHCLEFGLLAIFMVIALGHLTLAGEYSLSDAETFMRQERYNEAGDAFLYLHTQDPDNRWFIFEGVTALAWSGRYQEVVDLADDPLFYRPPRRSLEAAALANRHVGNFAKAMSFYEEGLERYPSISSFLLGIILTQLDTDQLDAAQASLEKYVALFGETEELTDARGYMAQAIERRRFNDNITAAGDLAREGKYSEALAILEALEKDYPDSLMLSYDLMATNSWADRHPEAVARADRLDLSVAPDYVLSATGRSLREVGRLVESEALFRRQLEKNPNNLTMLDGLVVTLIRLNQLDEAEQLIDSQRSPAEGEESAAEREVFDPQRYPPVLAGDEEALLAARRDAAAILGRQGDFITSITALNRLLRRHPENSGVLYDLILILSWADHRVEVLELVPRIDLEAAPAYVINTIALVHRRDGHPEAALPFYELSVRRFPDNVDSVAGLAMTLGDVGRPSEGLELLNTYDQQHIGIDKRAIFAARVYLYAPQPYTPPPRPTAAYRVEQDAIVTQARDGNLQAALPAIAALYQNHPDDNYILGDYITLAQWAGDNNLVLTLANNLDLSITADYVIQAVGRSLIVMGNHYGAHTFLDLAIEAQQGNAELMVVAAVVIAGGGDYFKAATYLQKALTSHTPGIANRVREARDRIGSDIIDSLLDLERIEAPGLNQGPIPPALVTSKTLALSGVHASHLSREIIQQGDPPPKLTPAQSNNIRMAAAKRTSVWGERSFLPRDILERSRFSLEAIQDLDAILNDPQYKNSTPMRVEAGAAKVKIFYEMAYFQEAIEEYLAIKDRGIPLSDGVLLAVAGSYMGLRCPLQAKAIYLEVLDRIKNPLPPANMPPIKDDIYQARTGLFWALLENEELHAALLEVEKHYQEGTATDGTALYQDNEYQKGSIAILRGLAWLYTGFMAVAEEELLLVVADAPGNPGALSALATTYSMRGLNRTAIDYIHRSQIFNPSDVGLAVAEAENLLNIQDWRATEAILEVVEPYREKVAAVRQLERDWETYNLHELRVDVAWGKVLYRSNEDETSFQGLGEEPTLEARLFSKPICYDWRLFGGIATSGGDFQEGHARRNVYMTGVEYRSPILTATLEARDDQVNGSHTFGLGLTGVVTPNDHWRFPFGIDYHSREAPLRARRDNGLTANLYQVGASRYWNESRSLNTRATVMNFSDGNVRLSLGGDFNQRLWTDYTRYIDGQISVATSTNSLDDNRLYFNPKYDLEIGGALGYSDLIWRCYEQSLRHTLTVGLGNYYQRYYGSGPVWSVSYSQSLVLSDRFSLNYGIAYGQRIYDGDRERMLNLYLSANYRF